MKEIWRNQKITNNQTGEEREAGLFRILEDLHGNNALILMKPAPRGCTALQSSEGPCHVVFNSTDFHKVVEYYLEEWSLDKEKESEEFLTGSGE